MAGVTASASDVPGTAPPTIGRVRHLAPRGSRLSLLSPPPRRHFFVRELVKQQSISVPFVKTTDNWADFFTKPLKPKHFTAMRNSIMNIA